MKDGVLKVVFFALLGEQTFRKQTCNKRVFGRIPWSKNLHLGRSASTKHWINFVSLTVIFMRSTWWQYLVWCWRPDRISAPNKLFGCEDHWLHFPPLNYPFQKEQTSPSLGQNTPYNQRLSTFTKLHVRLSNPFYSKRRYQQRSTFQMFFPGTLLRPQKNTFENLHQTSWLVGRRYIHTLIAPGYEDTFWLNMSVLQGHVTIRRLMANSFPSRNPLCESCCVDNFHF